MSDEMLCQLAAMTTPPMSLPNLEQRNRSLTIHSKSDDAQAKAHAHEFSISGRLADDIAVEEKATVLAVFVDIVLQPFDDGLSLCRTSMRDDRLHQLDSRARNSQGTSSRLGASARRRMARVKWSTTWLASQAIAEMAGL